MKVKTSYFSFFILIITASLLVLLILISCNNQEFVTGQSSPDSNIILNSDGSTTGSDYSSSSSSDSSPGDISNRNTLIVGSDSTFPPFEYEEKGQVIGFDVDIITEIAKRLGKEVNIEKIEWDPEFKSLREGNLDLVISAVSLNEEKDSIVDFSSPYFTMKYLLVSLVGSEIDMKENLDGSNVGLLESGKDCLDPEYLGKYEIIYYKDIIEMLEALKNKEVSAIFLNLPIAVNLLKDNKDIYTVIEEKDSTRQYVIVFNNGSSLKDMVDEQLDLIFSDGTYEQIYLKWFDYNSF